MENQPPQPERPKSQIYLQRAAPPNGGEGPTAPRATEMTTRRSTATPTQTNLPAVRPALPVLRSSATQRCPNCGAVQPASTSVCMACGAFIQSKAQKKIRCRRCGIQASANLVLCPGCGRELQAAPPRIGLFMASLIVVALFLVLLTRAVNFQPLAWAQTQATSGWNWILTLGARLDPQITINTIPVTPLAVDATNNGGLFSFNGADNATTVANPPANPPVDSGAVAATTLLTTGLATGDTPAVVGENSTISGLVGSEVISTPSLVVTTTVSGEPLVAVIPTATTLPTVAPSATPNPTATTAPTATPLPATATDLPATSTPVRTRQAVTATAQAILVAGNGATGTKAILLQPTATPLPTVAPTPTLTPVPPTPTANARTYTVRAGDTPFAIATQFDLTVTALLAANGLGLEDARRLRVGQTLVIPTLNDAPTATPTTIASPTTTATLASATATIAATLTPTAVAANATPASTVRLDAPRLRSPEPNSFLSCQGENTLTWLPVAFMRESDQYRLHLGFLTGYNGDGTEQVTWVLEQLMPASASLWQMDEGLCGLAPQSTGRQWRWYVEVVEAAGGGLQPVSQSSTIWGFSWN